jgi:hypothetical protein
MSDETFKLRYVGPRFQDARLPVDVLSDLPAFRDLLVAFAKDEWRNLHSGRRRVPKGFDKSLSFDLIGIENGSAVPALNWNRETAQALLPGFTDELEHIVRSSYGDVTRLIDDAGSERFPKSLASEQVRALNRLGAGLRDGERIEFQGSVGSDGHVIYLDTFRRKQLITRVRETYQTRFESIGTLVSNSVEGFIIVNTIEHGDITIPLDKDQILEEFDGSLQSDIQFDLQAELDNDDHLKRVISVYDIQVIDADIVAKLAACRVRLTHLAQLESGWHDGTGEKISDAAKNAADRLLTKRPSVGAEYRIYPTEGGGILFEFEANKWDLTVEFAADGSIEMYGVRVDHSDDLGPLTFDDLSDHFFEQFDVYVGRAND